MEVRELLSKYDFPGDDIPIVMGSALKALEGDQSDIGEPAILKLAEALDSYIPEPKRAIDGDFLMPVEDVFSISGRGTVVTGRIEQGQVKIGEEIDTHYGVAIVRKVHDDGDIMVNFPNDIDNPILFCSGFFGSSVSAVSFSCCI